MVSATNQTNRIKVGVIAAFIAILISVWLISDRPQVDAASTGPSPSHTGAPAEDTCVSCHVQYELNSGPGSVTISGVPATYSPGQAVQITVTTTDANATIYGFQFTAVEGTGVRAGTFSLPAQNPAQMQILASDENPLNRQYVEHTSDGIVPTVFGSKSWTFTWTAPTQSVGRVDFYVAANAANSDSSTSGDYIYTAATSLMPASSSSFSLSGQVRHPTGAGMGNVPVRLAGNDVILTAITSSFGFYTFPSLPGGVQYRLTVASKKYKFQALTPTLTSNLSNIDFVGEF